MADEAPPVVRVLKFLAGFVSGLMIVPVILLIAVVIIVFQRPPADTRPPAVLEIAGKDITSAGAASLDVDSVANRLHQACRDGCDDIRLSDQLHDVSAIRVLRADGTCVTCRKVGPYEAASRHWTVGGERLEIVNGGAP